ncbi:MAG: phosphoribosylamine--glycine ligase [Armatimonadetes bacterium]|nr:phosphoribosylamine--glycine ligase [Armatimonadota bacterium]
MNVLVVGSGGREHALAWKLAQSPSVERVLAAPGNPGIAQVADLHDTDATDFDAIGRICREESVDLVVVGPERPLIAGLADRLAESGCSAYGPSAAAAQIEASKAFAKRLMTEAGIPTARFETLTDFAAAKEYVESEHEAGRQVVVKASGEAFGKGAIVCDTAAEAIAAAERMLVREEFGEAGRTVIVEERLFGRELSLLAVCNGKEYRLLPAAQDYKAAYDGGRGPNTGGMGSYSPVAWIPQDEVEQLAETFIAPVLRVMEAQGTPYIGTLYAGLMVCEDGPRALEYNVRFGDPETQAILPLLESDLGELLLAAALGMPLPQITVSPEACVVVVIAANGYPSTYETNMELPDLDVGPDVILFHAGTATRGGKLVNSGGRVLNIAKIARDASTAARGAYEAIIGRFQEPWRYRTDIGRQATLTAPRLGETQQKGE